MNDIIKPPVGDTSEVGPAEKLAKTGTPAYPINAYVIIEKLPNRFPRIKPAKTATNVCKDTGTVTPPIGMASIGNQAVTFAPIAIKHTKTAPNVISTVRKRMNIPPFVLLYHKVEKVICQPLYFRGDEEGNKRLGQVKVVSPKIRITL